jgi:hypothetical protein
MLAFSRADILPEGGSEQCAFQIVGSHSVSPENSVGVTVVKDVFHRLSGAFIKDCRRAKYPDDMSVVFVVL